MTQKDGDEIAGECKGDHCTTHRVSDNPAHPEVHERGEFTVSGFSFILIF